MISVLFSFVLTFFDELQEMDSSVYVKEKWAGLDMHGKEPSLISVECKQPLPMCTALHTNLKNRIKP